MHVYLYTIRFEAVDETNKEKMGIKESKPLQQQQGFHQSSRPQAQPLDGGGSGGAGTDGGGVATSRPTHVVVGEISSAPKNHDEDRIEEKDVIPDYEPRRHTLRHMISPPLASTNIFAPSKFQDHVVEKGDSGSVDRDVGLARVATDKKTALIKAWEDNKKTKADNRSRKKLTGIASWENSKSVSLDAQMRKIEQKLEKKKARYTETMQNKRAELHKAAEQKKALAVARRSEDFLKAEEQAAKYRAIGKAPKRFLRCC